MPVKQKTRPTHHVAHRKEKRTKHFLKVYAPYIPLLLIVGCGIVLSSHHQVRGFQGSVQNYATNTTDDGLLEQTNKRRSEEGIKPLSLNTKLDAAAQAKADDMSAHNYWSHVTPDGREPWEFINATDYKYLKAAENLAFGFDNSKSTLTGWMNSPGHRANVMDPDLTEVGFGIANMANYQDHGPQTIVVAMYGEPTAESTPVPASAAPQTPVNTADKSQNVSITQSLTNGKAPWSSFVIGLVIGSIIMYLVVTHARGLRRAFRQGEGFVVHHPLFDVTLVALLALATIASQTVGRIY